MKNLKRYAVVIDTYIYAENDYEARQQAHDIKNTVYREFKSDGLRVADIIKCPYSSLTTQSLNDISEPESVNTWTVNDPLPF
tara:strand:+ start:465 stop:710 length:246 start_codon:yes stop_codon:yes gene_type:complete